MEWSRIPADTCKKIVSSYRNRLEAVIKKKSGMQLIIETGYE